MTRKVALVSLAREAAELDLSLVSSCELRGVGCAFAEIDYIFTKGWYQIKY